MQKKENFPMAKLTRSKLEEYGKKAPAKAGRALVRVGMSTCGIAAGAEEVYEALKGAVAQRNLDVDVRKCGCNGKCYAEPLVEVVSGGLPAVLYGKVDKRLALDIIDKHVVNGELLNDHIYGIDEGKGE
jgi:(2Fe-2S) ferredoxin